MRLMFTGGFVIKAALWGAFLTVLAGVLMFR